MRDFDEKPYSPDEERIAAFFAERGTGGGDDPVGAMLAGYAYIIEERKSLRAALREAYDFLQKIEGDGYGGMAAFEIVRETVRRESGHEQSAPIQGVPAPSIEQQPNAIPGARIKPKLVED